eukprot:tig00021537_g22263.t1
MQQSTDDEAQKLRDAAKEFAERGAVQERTKQELLSEDDRERAERLGLRPEALLAEETGEDEGAIPQPEPGSEETTAAHSRLRRGLSPPPQPDPNSLSDLLSTASSVELRLSGTEVKKIDSGEESHQRTGPLGDLLGVIMERLAPLQSVEISFLIETTVQTPSGPKRFAVRRLTYEIQKLRELLVASRPWIILPIHEESFRPPRSRC